MKDINMIYTDLIHQKREAEARLTEYQKKLEQLQERKSNIIIKKSMGIYTIIPNIVKMGKWSVSIWER